MDRHTLLFAEVEQALVSCQPDLHATLESDCIRIEGKFVCYDGAEPFDHYEIEVVVPWVFPEKEPGVWETGDRITRTVANHVYPKSGQCCLGLWEVWRIRNPEATFERYLRTHVHSYFVGQTVHAWTGDWVFGEEGHSAAAIAESYFEAIQFPQDSDRDHFFRLLCTPLILGNPPCPCGSGKKFKVCHREYIKDLRNRIPASVRKAMKKRLARQKPTKA